jgi:MFS transporter, DHA1 family, multidrug resistance protein
MYDIIRDSTLGQLIRYATRHKYFQYPEERSDFQCPYCYEKSTPTDSSVAGDATSGKDIENDVVAGDESPDDLSAEVEKDGIGPDGENNPQPTLSRVLSRSSAQLRQIRTAADLERAITQASRNAAQKMQSRPIAPSKTADGTILVDWYTTGMPKSLPNLFEC